MGNDSVFPCASRCCRRKTVRVSVHQQFKIHTKWQYNGQMRRANMIKTLMENAAHRSHSNRFTHHEDVLICHFESKAMPAPVSRMHLHQFHNYPVHLSLGIASISCFCSDSIIIFGGKIEPELPFRSFPFVYSSSSFVCIYLPHIFCSLCTVSVSFSRHRRGCFKRTRALVHTHTQLTCHSYAFIYAYSLCLLQSRCAEPGKYK